MNGADLVVFAVLFLFGLGGLSRGLFGFLMGIMIWAGAGIATYHGFPVVRPFSRELISDPVVADMAAGLVLFAVLVICLRLIVNHALGDFRFGAFGLINRLLGLVVGLSLGYIILCGAYAAGHRILGLSDQSEFFRDSRTLPWIRQGAAILMPSLEFIGDGKVIRERSVQGGQQ